MGGRNKKVTVTSGDCHRALLKSPECGDTIEVTLKIEKRKIKKTTFRAFGCGSLHDAAEIIAKSLNGKTVDSVKNLKVSAIVKKLKLPAIRTHCVRLALSAFRQAALE